MRGKKMSEWALLPWSFVWLQRRGYTPVTPPAFKFLHTFLAFSEHKMYSVSALAIFLPVYGLRLFQPLTAEERKEHRENVKKRKEEGRDAPDSDEEEVVDALIPLEAWLVAIEGVPHPGSHLISPDLHRHLHPRAAIWAVKYNNEHYQKQIKGEPTFELARKCTVMADPPPLTRRSVLFVGPGCRKSFFNNTPMKAHLMDCLRCSSLHSSLREKFISSTNNSRPVIAAKHLLDFFKFLLEGAPEGVTKEMLATELLPVLSVLGFHVLTDTDVIHPFQLCKSLATAQA